jgi:ABC-2 type transport system ATP-binding protein/lipopolysaccharide transport system ATP-binding protein
MAEKEKIELIHNAVTFENISVMYRVPKEKLSGIKEYAIRLIQRQLQYEDFWALRELSLQVKKGEVFGIVGRNGAGKSTTLKVIARVLQPTRGRMVTRGSISPFLELGAGFHPELTGRENIFLNSALLGHSRVETNEHLLEIIEFAGIGDFIEAPIRTYSTGMIARLGFSVATTFQPDVLLIDEVLSVGDVKFQEKCINRMNSFRDQGTTIIIVSHDMGMVSHFCERAAWLSEGQIQAIGPASDVVRDYVNRGQLPASE